MIRAVAALVLVLPIAAYATVYTWTDSRGARHYANKEYDIPVRYRAKVKTLYPDQPETSPTQQSPQSRQITQPLQQQFPQTKTDEPSTAVSVEAQKDASQQPAKRSRRNRAARSSEGE